MCVISEYSVQFSSSHSVVSDSLRPHEPQHTRPPCPSPTPGVHPNPYPLCWWYHPIISSSVVPFSSCPQSFPASGSFKMSQFFTSGNQRTGVSASTSVLPMKTQVLTQPRQKEIEPSPQEREEGPWTRPVEMVSKRSQTGRTSDRQREQARQTYGVGQVIDPVESNSQRRKE